MLPRRFKQVDGSERVYLEIENGNFASFVMRGLRRAMDDEVEPLRAKQFVERGAVADVEAMMEEVLGARFQPFEIPGSVALGAEEEAAHVVVHADHTMALAVEMLDGFGADQAAAAGDEDGLHGVNQGLDTSFLVRIGAAASIMRTPRR